MRKDSEKVDVKTVSTLTVNRPKSGAEKSIQINVRHTESIVIHHFPGLLPFGDTVLKIRNGKWAIKCGQITLDGHGGTVDEIVVCFVQHANQEVLVTKWAVESDSFTTERI